MIFAPYLHRNRRLPDANRFAPEAWLREGAGGVDLDGRAHAEWPLVPFSAGPAICPGRQLVLLVASNVLGRVLEAHAVHLVDPQRLDPARPLPGTLDSYTLRFFL